MDTRRTGDPALPPVPQWGVDPLRPRKLTLYGIGFLALVALAILLGLGAAGVFQLRSPSSSGGVLQARGESAGPGLLQARGEQGPPVLEARSQAPTHTDMPADVRDWLEHLRRCEEKRTEMSQRQLSQAMVLMAELNGGGASMGTLEGLLDEAGGGDPSGKVKSPTKTAAEDTDAMQREWVKLDEFFNSKAPPEECIPLRNSYDQVLRETGGMMRDILDAVNGATSDPQGALTRLQGMIGKSQKMIDKPAKNTDDGVAGLCRKYDTRKWFDIASDFGGGMLGKPSF